MVPPLAPFTIVIVVPPRMKLPADGAKVMLLKPHPLVFFRIQLGAAGKHEVGIVGQTGGGPVQRGRPVNCPSPRRSR